MWLGWPSSTAFQAEAPPVGLVVVIMSRAGSSATQSRVLGHEIVSKGTLLGAAVLVQADVPPMGLVEVRIGSPAAPEPEVTHRRGLGQDTAPRVFVPSVAPSTAADIQAEAPPVGLVEVRTWAWSSEATQSRALAQETASKPLAPSTAAATHAEAPPVGSVEVTT